MLTLPWKFSLWWHLASLFGADLPAGHTNSKLALEIFPPRSLTQQYDWLTKIWDIAHAIPRVAESRENLWESLRAFASAGKKSTLVKGWKMFASSVYFKVWARTLLWKKLCCWSEKLSPGSCMYRIPARVWLPEILLPCREPAQIPARNKNPSGQNLIGTSVWSHQDPGPYFTRGCNHLYIHAFRIDSYHSHLYQYYLILSSMSSL